MNRSTGHDVYSNCDSSPSLLLLFYLGHFLDFALLVGQRAHQLLHLALALVVPAMISVKRVQYGLIGSYKGEREKKKDDGRPKTYRWICSLSFWRPRKAVSLRISRMAPFISRRSLCCSLSRSCFSLEPACFFLPSHLRAAHQTSVSFENSFHNTTS